MAKNDTQTLSFKGKFSYCAGGVGRDMAYNLVNAQILSFLMLTRNLGDAELAVITIIMVVCRIFDGLNDPIMGTIIEHTHNKKGKFKPWLLIGVVTNVAVIMAIYGVQLKSWNYVIFFAFAYLLWGITYTMNDISYWSMLPALSNDKRTRDGLSSWANLLAGMGSGIAGAITPMFTTGDFAIVKSSMAISYVIIAAIICIFFLGCQLMTYFGAPHTSTLLDPNETASRTRSTKPLADMWNVIKSNDQLRWVALSMFLYNVGASVVTNAMTIYIYLTYGLQGFLITVFGLLFGIFGGIPMMFYSAFSKKLTRRQMVFVSMFLVVFGYILFFCTGIAWSTGNMMGDFVMLALCGIFISMGQSFLYNIQTISVSNCVEYNEYKTGERKEGIIFALRPLMAKIGSAVQLGIVTLIYIALGVNSLTNQISALDTEATLGHITAEAKDQQIEAIINSFPPETGVRLKLWICIAALIFVMAGALVLYFKSKITEDEFERLQSEIAARKAGENPAIAEDSFADEYSSDEDSADVDTADKYSSDEDSADVDTADKYGSD